MSDLIDRQAAIATAIKAAVDWHKLANPQYSIAYCIGEAMRQLPPANNSEFPNSSDCISRQAAIDAVNCVMIIKGIRSGKSIVAEAVESAKRIMTDNIRDLPPAQLAPDNNGDIWITVPDIDKVTRIYVQESKSKFCRIFYEEKEQPERIRGRWIAKEKKNLFRCSKCDAVIYSESEYDRNEFHKFCGRCGADMREVTT